MEKDYAKTIWSAPDPVVRNTHDYYELLFDSEYKIDSMA